MAASENKTKPTEVAVESFLDTVGERRRAEADQLIAMMTEVSGEQPVMWGPSIIGFGSVHYRYDSGREGDMPILAFSPRKGALTVYFSEGFDRYRSQLAGLGKHRTSVSCLYVTKLSDIDLEVLRDMLAASYQHHTTTETNHG